MKFDATLLVAFGGPEKKADIPPFLGQVIAGRQIPEERLAAVALHYEAMGGRSPLNEWTRRQAAALAIELHGRGRRLPIACGMRNWHPFLVDTLRGLYNQGVREVFAIILAAHDCEAGRQRYVENLKEAQRELGSDAPRITLAPNWHARAGYIRAAAERIRFATHRMSDAERRTIPLVFTAHSIPVAMAEASEYVAQLRTSAAGVATELGCENWQIAWQSRSGRPQDAWLEPDISDKLSELALAGAKRVIVSPLGFVCDHVEVLWDLDHQAKQRADALGIEMIRAGTVADHPEFIAMLADLLSEAEERE
ncbi:MAG: ferrochelatase [Deltaproteobacteria bacterium]